jgi:hypothetical protein
MTSQERKIVDRKVGWVGGETGATQLLAPDRNRSASIDGWPHGPFFLDETVNWLIF